MISNNARPLKKSQEIKTVCSDPKRGRGTRRAKSEEVFGRDPVSIFSPLFSSPSSFSLIVLLLPEERGNALFHRLSFDSKEGGALRVRHETEDRVERLDAYLLLAVETTPLLHPHVSVRYGFYLGGRDEGEEGILLCDAGTRLVEDVERVDYLVEEVVDKADLLLQNANF